MVFESPMRKLEDNQDLAGDLCDAWREQGYGFSVGEDGEISRIDTAPGRTVDIPHDPRYFKSIVDEAGHEHIYLKKHIPVGMYARLGILVDELPIKYVVHTTDAVTHELTRHGIKLNAIPAVAELVADAYTKVPAAGVYPPEAIAMAPDSREFILEYFEAALKTPEQKESENSAEQHELREKLRESDFTKNWLWRREKELKAQVAELQKELKDTAEAERLQRQRDEAARQRQAQIRKAWTDAEPTRETYRRLSMGSMFAGGTQMGALITLILSRENFEPMAVPYLTITSLGAAALGVWSGKQAKTHGRVDVTTQSARTR